MKFGWDCKEYEILRHKNSEIPKTLEIRNGKPKDA